MGLQIPKFMENLALYWLLKVSDSREDREVMLLSYVIYVFQFLLQVFAKFPVATRSQEDADGLTGDDASKCDGVLLEAVHRNVWCALVAAAFSGAPLAPPMNHVQATGCHRRRAAVGRNPLRTFQQ